MHDSPPQASDEYCAYMLRIWRASPEAPWRASLQRAPGDARIGFADLEQLAAYLLRLDDGADAQRAPHEPPALSSPL